MQSEREILDEIERHRRQAKWDRIRHECATVPQMFSLWQETSDLLFRTNFSDDARVEELHHLRTVAFALAAEAHKQGMPRASLQRLQSVLRTLMPGEWFHDRTTRELVAGAVHAANVEVQELYFASVLSTGSGGADSGTERNPISVSRASSGPIPAARAIENDVERAFDLLMHYRDGLQDRPDGSAPDRESLRALGQLEDVMREWLPRADSAQDPLITSVQKIIGRRDEAKILLTDADLWGQRQACLQRLAAETYPGDATTRDLVKRCRAELGKWRSLQPLTKRVLKGSLAIDAHAQIMAQSVTHYWSTDLTSRPSRMGASFFLAAACDAVAHDAQRKGVPREAILPSIHLPVRLRRNPDWARMESSDASRLLQEQLDLACGVEDLLAELAATPERQQEPRPELAVTPERQLALLCHVPAEFRTNASLYAY